MSLRIETEATANYGGIKRKPAFFDPFCSEREIQEEIEEFRKREAELLRRAELKKSERSTFDVGNMPLNGIQYNESTDDEATKLTPTELKYVHYVAAGLSGKEIAARETGSYNTVKNHFTNIFKKSGMGDRLQLLIYAIQNGLVEISVEPEEARIGLAIESASNIEVQNIKNVAEYITQNEEDYLL